MRIPSGKSTTQFAPFLEGSGRLVGRHHRRSRGSTDQQALLANQSTRQAERLCIVGLYPTIDESAVQDPGDEVVADAFNLVGLDRVGSSEDRAFGVCRDNDRVRTVLFDLPSDSGQSAAGAGPNHYHVDLSIQVIDDLLPSAEVMGLRIGVVRVLIEDM